MGIWIAVPVRHKWILHCRWCRERGIAAVRDIGYVQAARPLVVDLQDQALLAAAGTGSEVAASLQGGGQCPGGNVPGQVNSSDPGFVHGNVALDDESRRLCPVRNGVRRSKGHRDLDCPRSDTSGNETTELGANAAEPTVCTILVTLKRALSGVG